MRCCACSLLLRHYRMEKMATEGGGNNCAWNLPIYSLFRQFCEWKKLFKEKKRWRERKKGKEKPLKMLKKNEREELRNETMLSLYIPFVWSFFEGIPTLGNVWSWLWAEKILRLTWEHPLKCCTSLDKITFHKKWIVTAKSHVACKLTDGNKHSLYEGSSVTSF